MSTVTYTFAEITNPSGTHIAWGGFNQEDPPSGGALVQAVEASSADYAALAASDNSRAESKGLETTAFASHALWEFDWLITVPRAEVTRIDISCEGLGFADSGDGWRLHVRKNTGVGAPVWELLNTEPTSGEVTLTGAITADILDYITEDGHIYVLAEQVGTYVESVASTIQVDMTSCQLTYTSVTAPTITISAATAIEPTTARLNGDVTATGGENPTVTMYWGKTDGGQTPGNWTNSSAPTSPGQPQGVAAFYKDATGLDSVTLYYFSAKATNSAGTGWPAASLSFTTLSSFVQAQCSS